MVCCVAPRSPPSLGLGLGCLGVAPEAVGGGGTLMGCHGLRLPLGAELHVGCCWWQHTPLESCQDTEPVGEEACCCRPQLMTHMLSLQAGTMTTSTASRALSEMGSG